MADQQKSVTSEDCIQSGFLKEWQEARKTLHCPMVTVVQTAAWWWLHHVVGIFPPFLSAGTGKTGLREKIDGGNDRAVLVCMRPVTC